MTTLTNTQDRGHKAAPESSCGSAWGPIARAVAFLDRVDPGTHRRIKGLRLVTAYGIAAMLGTLLGSSYGIATGTLLGSLASGFALWASVSEGQATRVRSSRDLALFSAAGVLGAFSMLALAPLFGRPGWPGTELTLVTGSFLVGYLKRFGIVGAGIGSQMYIGQVLVYGAGSTRVTPPMILLAGVIAAVAAIVPRLLSGPAEHPIPAPAIAPDVATPRGFPSPEVRMGSQAAIAALSIVLLNNLFGLEESAWAITACTYVIAGSAAGTIDRVHRRIVGTVIAVPLALACLPIFLHARILGWVMAAVAMIVYAMALPERYDIACGAYAFTLLVTLALTGDTSTVLLASRAWETLIGGAIGLGAAMFVLPLRSSSQEGK
jgi:Fusaric acid resistance protein-like